MIFDILSFYRIFVFCSVATVYLSCILLYLVLSSTVDQTVNTVLVQLGAARHLY
jgi:hypothetical protein